MPATTLRLSPIMRYDMRPDRVGWTVIDVTTGLPVWIDDLLLSGIDHDEADRLVDLLNAHDRQGCRGSRDETGQR